MIDALTVTQSAKDLILLEKPAIGDDHPDGLANGFMGGVAEQTLRAAIPCRDDTVERFADDSVVRIFDHGSKPGAGFEGLSMALNTAPRDGLALAK